MQVHSRHARRLRARRHHAVVVRPRRGLRLHFWHTVKLEKALGRSWLSALQYSLFLYRLRNL